MCMCVDTCVLSVLISMWYVLTHVCGLYVDTCVCVSTRVCGLYVYTCVCLLIRVCSLC